MKKSITLNQPVFAQEAFDSSSLSVLTTLFHRFTEVGDYEVFVRRSEQVIHRARVSVAAEGGSYQINVDMAKLGDVRSTCECESGYGIALGGAIGFHASEGVAKYSVLITRLDKREKQTVLDSSRAIPAGDFFAVTLVRPGLYQVLNFGERGRGKGEVKVTLPKKGDRIPVEQVTMIEAGDQGALNPSAARLTSGQSIVFQCKLPTRIQVQMVKPDDAIGGGGGVVPRPPGPVRPPRHGPVRVSRGTVFRRDG